MKILIIEDDAETAAYIANGLKEHGHTVDLAATGRDGLFLAAGERYDLMVVDRMLPEIDGLSIVKTVRTAGIETPVLFLTALGGVDECDRRRPAVGPVRCGLARHPVATSGRWLERHRACAPWAWRVAR